MQTTKRSFEFTRTTVSRGIFRSPEIRFELRQPGSESALGHFVIHGRDAEWVTGDGKCNFRIRRSFWGQKWNYAGTGEGREFARIRLGLFKNRIAFAEGGEYHIRLKRGGLIFPKRRYALLAELFHADDVVVTLINTRRRRLFGTDSRRPMAGSIDSALPGMAELWGMLLLFQHVLQTREAVVSA